MSGIREFLEARKKSGYSWEEFKELKAKKDGGGNTELEMMKYRQKLDEERDAKLRAARKRKHTSTSTTKKKKNNNNKKHTSSDDEDKKRKRKHIQYKKERTSINKIENQSQLITVNNSNQDSRNNYHEDSEMEEGEIVEEVDEEVKEDEQNQPDIKRHHRRKKSHSHVEEKGRSSSISVDSHNSRKKIKKSETQEA